MIIYKYNKGEQPKYFLQTPNAEWQQKTNKGSSFELNNVAAEILEQFNGLKSYDQIVAYFQFKYNEQPEIIERNIAILLNTMKENYSVEVKTSNTKHNRMVEVIEYNGIYPTVVTIELTSRCNILCRHCYGFFGECSAQDVPYEKLKPLFENLAEAGVITVEMTGGDPSTYRYVSEAIEIAIRSGIRSIMLLTNGIALSQKLVRTLEKYKDNVFVQIDLHSLDDNYYDWFTGSQNKLSRVKSNIDLLISKNIPVRIVTIVTQKNVHEIESIADWSYSHGAEAFAASTVVAMGRADGATMEEALFLSTEESFMNFVNIYKKIDNKYPDFIRIVSEERYASESCGALLSSVSIKSNGNLKICTMDTGDYFNLDFGNVFQEKFTDIYDRSQNFLTTFSQVTLPDVLTICKDCEHNLYCNRCILRGMQKASEKKDECIWYRNFLPEELKKKLVTKCVG
ncbi:PqqD family peptide modification chaperone [Enterococcus sp. AZ128]|uniref:radical SAM protein n=1 Tax=unclassified Enterococcus TaxID=2608891 RepID=UPI003F68634F